MSRPPGNLDHSFRQSPAQPASPSARFHTGVPRQAGPCDLTVQVCVGQQQQAAAVSAQFPGPMGVEGPEAVATPAGYQVTPSAAFRGQLVENGVVVGGEVRVINYHQHWPRLFYGAGQGAVVGFEALEIEICPRLGLAAHHHHPQARLGRERCNGGQGRGPARAWWPGHDGVAGRVEHQAGRREAHVG